MSEVKRYDFRSDYDVNSDGVVQTSAVYASDDGDYVLFTDHDALLADQLQAHQCAEQMLKDDIAALKEQLLAAQRRLGEQWQPIETAPKDGRVVLFCDAHGNRWTDAEHGVCASNDCGYPAVYWMELPLPPITPAPQAKESE
jgi:hypothetical protein